MLFQQGMKQSYYNNWTKYVAYLVVECFYFKIYEAQIKFTSLNIALGDTYIQEFLVTCANACTSTNTCTSMALLYHQNKIIRVGESK